MGHWGRALSGGPKSTDQRRRRVSNLTTIGQRRSDLLLQHPKVSMAAVMDFAPFLAFSAVVDGDHPDVRRLAETIGRKDPLTTIQAAYQLVRDEFAHSYDIGATDVSVSASDVVRNGHGICFAKSHLLAGLLRASGIPAGLCYQKLARTDRGPGGSCLHGLNAVWLEGSWRRLDPRGNKPTTELPFDPNYERLAYTIEITRGERDYPDVFSEPLRCVLLALSGSDTVAELDRNLPPDLD